MSNKEFYEKVKRFDIWQYYKGRTNLTIDELLRHKILLKLVPANKKVLDLGCGYGYMSYLMAKKGNKVTALDIVQSCLDRFKEVAKKYSIRQVLGDISKIQLEKFDVIVCQELLEHLEDYSSVLRKCYSILNKGGIGIFSVPHNENLEAKRFLCPYCLKTFHKNGHLHRFTSESLKKDMEDAGFTVESLFICVNKRTRKTIRALGLPVKGYALHLDKFWSQCFPNKSSYLVSVVRK